MTRFKTHALVLLCLGLSAALPRAAHAAESYDNCTGFIDSLPATITTQGTWCLRRDLSTAITTGAAITIANNNITINCNDFKLGGLAAGAGTLARGIEAANRFNTTVRSCNIRGFFYGLMFWGGGHTVEDNRFEGNTWTAMDLEGDGSTVRRNLVFNTGGSTQTNSATGILVLDSADIIDNTVSGVTAIGNGFAIGINTQSNPDGRVIGNGVRGVVSAGPAAGGATAGIYNNTAGTAGRIALRDNDVVGDGSTGSVGISCDTSNSRARNNVISGFATAIVSCSNDGGNALVP
ncbi:MAG TPA: hypothetical protein VGD21_01660 [Lysobacter sp.]